MTERLDIMLIKSAAIIFALAVALMTSEADAADTENCLMCHKYRQLGRIDESGMKRSYFVSESKYAASVHRNVPCRDCHTSITKLPHDPVTEEVNCANECHVKPPFATENFSHKKIMQLYDSSVHGVSTEDSPEMSEAKPTCKYCHLNPLFSDVELKVVSDASLQRCMNCHEEKGVSQAYMHITHRLRHKTSRSPKEIVQMCSLNCHGDTEYMKSLDPSKKRLEAVATYESSIHGKSVSLGSEKAADCISCHATNGIHDIYSKEDIRSTLNTVNRSETCRQCHLQVNESFIKIDVHSSIDKDNKPVLYLLNTGLSVILYGTVFSLLGLACLETWGRRRRGINWELEKGTSWRKKDKQPKGD